MPNTPAMVGRGITAMMRQCAWRREDDMALAEALMAAVGQVVRLEGEHQIDAVTAVSGSGPAYVFHLIEAMAAAGEAEGLPADVADATGPRHGLRGGRAGASARRKVRRSCAINVTSPGGTTAAALGVLMDAETGFPALLRRAVKAAADRGRELGK